MADRLNSVVVQESGMADERGTQLPGRAAAVGRWWPLLVVVLLTGLGLFLRRYQINQQSFWFDEADMVALAKADLGSLLTDFTQASANGPLYTLILHGWMRVFGDSEAAVRALSALFGAATIPLLYAFASALWGRAGRVKALLAAGLLTVAPFHIWYSQEAKMYTLVVLLTLASMYAFLHALRSNRGSDWLLYVLLTWLSLSSHAMAVLVLGAQLSYYLLAHLLAKKRLGKKWGLATLLLLLPFVPILITRAEFLFRSTTVSRFYQPTSLLEIAQTVVVKFSLNQLPAGRVVWETAGGLLFAALVAVGLLLPTLQGLRQPAASPSPSRTISSAHLTPAMAKGISSDPRLPTAKLNPTLLLACYLLVPIILFWLLTLRAPLFEARYLIVALPAWLLLVADGVFALVGRQPQAQDREESVALRGFNLRWLALLAVVPLLGFSLWALAGYNYSKVATKEDWRGAMLYIKTHMRVGDTIIVYPGYLKSAVDYYMIHGPGPANLPQVVVNGIEPKLVISGTQRELDSAEAGVINGARRAWLLQSPTRVRLEDKRQTDEQWAGSVWWWLSGNYIQEDKRGEFSGLEVYSFNFNGVVGSYYPRPQTYAANVYSAPNGDRLTLLGFNYEPRGQAWLPFAPTDNLTQGAGTSVTTTRADFFPLVLYWRVDNQASGKPALQGSYTMNVQLVDAAGKPVTSQLPLPPFGGYQQTAGWRLAETFTDFRDIWVGGNTAPGDYRLAVSVYANGQPDQLLTASDSEGHPLGTAPTLSRTVKVVPEK